MGKISLMQTFLGENFHVVRNKKYSINSPRWGIAEGQTINIVYRITEEKSLYTLVETITLTCESTGGFKDCVFYNSEPRGSQYPFIGISGFEKDEWARVLQKTREMFKETKE